MTDNRTTELLPCPFCGGEAELKRYQSGDWQVICYHADGCIMLESDLDNCYWENVQTLARQWNTRAELGSGTCEVVSSRFDEMMDEWCIELSCGHCVWDRTEPPNFCEECGAHIRKAVAR